MPTRYDPNSHFDPEVATVMREAFDSAWETVKLSGAPDMVDGKADWARETLGLRIIETAQKGERDPIRLQEDALAHLAEVNRRNENDIRANRPISPNDA